MKSDNRVLCYGLYVDPKCLQRHIEIVRNEVKYAWEREYSLDRAGHLVYIVTGHHIKREEAAALYEEFKHD